MRISSFGLLLTCLNSFIFGGTAIIKYGLLYGSSLGKETNRSLLN